MMHHDIGTPFQTDTQPGRIHDMRNILHTENIVLVPPYEKTVEKETTLLIEIDFAKNLISAIPE